MKYIDMPENVIGVLRVWDLTTSKCLLELEGLNDYRSLAVLSDGRLAVAAGKYVQIWRFEAKRNATGISTLVYHTARHHPSYATLSTHALHTTSMSCYCGYDGIVYRRLNVSRLNQRMVKVLNV
jgi:WD40 repeat protein